MGFAEQRPGRERMGSLFWSERERRDRLVESYTKEAIAQAGVFIVTIGTSAARPDLAPIALQIGTEISRFVSQGEQNNRGLLRSLSE